MAPGRNMGARDWGILLALSVLWGGSFFFIEFALTGFAPFTLVFARVALASSVLWLILRATGGAMPSEAAAWRALAVMALLNSAVPWSLFTLAQTGITGGLASILNATTPIWGVAIAHFFTADEKATPGRIAGMVLGFAGVVAMIGPDALHGLRGDLLPQLACVAATLCYAISGVYGRRIGALGVTPLAAATGQLGLAAVLLLPVMLAVDAPWNMPAPPGIAWAALLALAMACTALAFVLFFRLLARAGATNTMLVTFLIPVTAILLGSLVLHERLETQHAIGMALIALGLVAVDGRVPRLAWRMVRPTGA